jgi:hypothetical protein
LPFFFFFKTEAQAGLETDKVYQLLKVIPSECWYYRPEPPCLTLGTIIGFLEEVREGRKESVSEIEIQRK